MGVKAEKQKEVEVGRQIKRPSLNHVRERAPTKQASHALMQHPHLHLPTGKLEVQKQPTFCLSLTPSPTFNCPHPLPKLYLQI